MQRPHVLKLNRHHRHEAHDRTLGRFGDCPRVVVVVGVRAHADTGPGILTDARSDGMERGSRPATHPLP